ncbi:hypothetical protein GGF44_004045 [Coemansia sp. RSA 1694]|nr:hypothetical protein GGF44_004045 [Coemansia sp. RSA 1694]
MDDRWTHHRSEAAGVSQLSLASILSSDTRPNPSSASTLQHLLSPAAGEQPPPAVYAPSPGSASDRPSIRDIAGLLHRLDRSADSYDDDDDDEMDLNDSDSVSKACGVGGMIERMRALASESSAADVSSAVRQIMSYVERESRRRHVQSERHHRVVAALADILAQSTASSTAAPSAAASRRSSGVEREWSPQHMSRHGLLLQNVVVPHPPSCESTPTDSPPGGGTSR